MALPLGPLQTSVKIPMSHSLWAKIPLGTDSPGTHPLGLFAPTPNADLDSSGFESMERR
jgi:hypothetical protein